MYELRFHPTTLRNAALCNRVLQSEAENVLYFSNRIEGLIFARSFLRSLSSTHCGTQRRQSVRKIDSNGRYYSEDMRAEMTLVMGKILMLLDNLVHLTMCTPLEDQAYPFRLRSFETRTGYGVSNSFLRSQLSLASVAVWRGPRDDLLSLSILPNLTELSGSNETVKNYLIGRPITKLCVSDSSQMDGSFSAASTCPITSFRTMTAINGKFGKERLMHLANTFPHLRSLEAALSMYDGIVSGGSDLMSSNEAEVHILI